jgi:hypothetical protein
LFRKEKKLINKWKETNLNLKQLCWGLGFGLVGLVISLIVELDDEKVAFVPK